MYASAHPYHEEQAPFKGRPASDVEHGEYMSHQPSVEACEAAVRAGFLRKVFGLVAAQLAVTAVMCGLAMYEPHTRALVLASPSLLMISFLASFGFLFGAQAYKDVHPTNLYLVLGFTVSLGWGVAVTCARFQQAGLGLVVLEAVALTDLKVGGAGTKELASALSGHAALASLCRSTLVLSSTSSASPSCRMSAQSSRTREETSSRSTPHCVHSCADGVTNRAPP